MDHEVVLSNQPKVLRRGDQLLLSPDHKLKTPEELIILTVRTNRKMF